MSTDSKKYAEIAKQYGAEVPFLRPAEHSTDKSPIVDTVEHLLEKLKADESYEPDYMMLLQTTSPLRTAEDITQCIEVMKEKQADALMTMASTEQLLYTIDPNGYLELLFNKDWLTSTNRQTLPATYKINGPAVLIVNCHSLRKNLQQGVRSLISGRVAGVVMEKRRSPDLHN